MQERQPLRVWPTFLSFMVALGALYVGSALLILTALVAQYGTDAIQKPALIQTLLKDPLILLASVVLSSSVVTCTALGGARLSSQPFAERLSLNRPGLAPVSYLLVVLAAPALGQVLETAVALLGIEVDGTLKHLNESIASASGWLVPAIVIAISVGPGIGEELLFRGFMQTRLSARFGPALGIALASLLFGLLHMDPIHSVLAAILGLYLGFVAERFRSIVPAILAHTVNNLTAALMIFLAPQAHEEAAQVSLAPGILGGLFFAFCVWWIIRATPRQALAASHH